MSDCSSSVTKYIIVEPSTHGTYSGLTICGGGGLTVDFITGCTSDGVNVSGGIFNGGVLTIPTINATTFSGGTLYGDGSNLTGISTIDSYMTGGTYSNGFITFSGSGIFSDVTVDVSALLDDTNSYVTGSTLNGDTLELGRNGGLSTLTTDLSSINTDNYVSGGTYSSGNLFFSGTSTNQSFSIDVSALIDDTNSFVTGGTLSGNNLILGRNGGLSNVITDLSPLLFTGNTSGNCITDLHISNLYGCSPITVHDDLIINESLTAKTFTITNTPIVNNTITDIIVRDVDGSIKTRSLSSITGLTSSDNYVTGATMDGNTLELGRNGLTDVTVDLSQFVDSDTSVTGLTFNPTTYNLTLSQDNGKPSHISNLATLASDIFVLSGVYDISTGIVTYTTNSGTTFQVSGFTSGMTDSYTSSANLSGNEIQFNNNIQGTNLYNVDLTPLLSGKTNNTDFYSYTASTQVLLDSKVDGSTFISYTANTLNILNTKVDAGINVGGGSVVFSGKSGSDLYFRTLSGGSNTTLTTVDDVVKIDVAVPSGDNFFTTGGSVTQSATSGSTEITLQIVGNSGFTPYSITGITDTFVNDFTFSANTLTISQNDGTSFNSSIETIELGNILSAVTFDIGTSGSISATTFYGDGSNLTGIVHTTDTFVSGGTYSNNNLYFSGNSIETTFSVDVSALIDDTNSFVTGSTLNGNTLELSRNGGLSTLSTDFLPILSGKTNNTDFYSYTASTQSVLNSKVNDSTFISYTANTQNILNTKIDGGINVGGGNEIFSGITGTDMNFRTLSGGSNTTLTTIGDVVKIDVTIPSDVNTYVTGFTIDTNQLILTQNDGTSGFTVDLSPYIDNTDNYVTGGTMVGNTLVLNRTDQLSAATIDLSQFVDVAANNYYLTGGTKVNNSVVFGRNDTNGILTLSGGTNITISEPTTGVFKFDSLDTDTNTFVSGGTMIGNTLVLNRTDALSAVTVDMSQFVDDTNFYVTGFTYNNTNQLRLGRNGGLSDLTTSIDIMSGLTVNGNSVFSGTGTDVVQIYGSGSTTPILRVEGSSGELFSITDSLTGELFAVNNVSAETILSVNSDNTILWGDPTVPSLNTTVKKSINSGSTEIYSIPVSAYTGGFFEYSVTGAGARAGSIMSIFSGTSIDFNETTTNDIGDTSGITFDMNVSGGTANLTVSATTNTWEIRTIVRSI